MKISYAIRRADGRVTLSRHVDTGPSIKFERIPEGASRSVRDMSENFEMGFIGPGPQQLALAILVDVTGNRETSVLLSRDFMLEFLSAGALTIDADAVEYDADSILEWVKREVAKHV